MPETRETDSAATDHLIQLPKMSTTAGVGTYEYVAVNVGAVFSLLVGFASILSLMDRAFLVIPITAIVLAVIALHQINGSNGTQTGRGVALSGLFLAVVFCSFVVSGMVIESLGRRADRAAIAAVIEKFGEDVRDHDYDGSYALFSQRFQSRVDRKTFIATVKGMQDELAAENKTHQGIGEVNGAHSNGLVLFFSDPESGAVTGQTEMLLTFANSTNTNPKVVPMRKSGSTWFIDDIFQFFPSKKSR